MGKELTKAELKRFLVLRLIFSVSVSSVYVFYKTYQGLQQNMEHFDKLIIELSLSESRFGKPITDSVIYDLLETNTEFVEAVRELKMNPDIPILQVTDPSTTGNIALKIKKGGAKFVDQPLSLYQKPTLLEQCFNVLKTSLTATGICIMCFGLSGVLVNWVNGELQQLKFLSNSDLFSAMRLIQDTRRNKRLSQNFLGRIQLLFDKKLWDQLKLHMDIVIDSKIDFNRLQYIILNMLELCPSGVNHVVFVSLLITLSISFSVLIAGSITCALLCASIYFKILFLGSASIFFIFDAIHLKGTNLKIMLAHLAMLIDGASNFSKPESSAINSPIQTELIHKADNQPVIAPEPSRQLPESTDQLEWPTIKSPYPDALEMVRAAQEKNRQQNAGMVDRKAKFEEIMYGKPSPSQPPQSKYEEPPQIE